MRSLALLLLFASTASAAEPVEDWKSILDAPKDRIDWTVAAKLRVVTPPHFFEGGVAFADNGGPFAAAGRNGEKRGSRAEEYRVIADLRTGKVVSTIRDQLDTLGHTPPTALSHDGKQFAAAIGGGFGQGPGKVGVFDTTTATAKLLGEMPITGETDALQIAGTRLLVATKVGVDVFDLSTRKSIFNVEHKRSNWGAARTILTPTGKFVIDATENGLRIYDVESTKLLFKMDSPRHQKDKPTNADGMAISPDGKKLIILTEEWNNRRLVTFDTATGKVLNDTPTAFKNTFHGNRVGWSVDGKGLLLNSEATADPETGKVVFEFANNTHPIKLALTLGQGVVWERAGNDRVLTVAGLDVAKTAAAKAAVASGGTAADASLHPLTKSTLDKSKAIAVPLVGANWTAKPDPAPPTTAGQRPIPVDFPMNNMRALFINPAPKPVALFEFTPNGGDASKPRQAKRVDLLTGKTTATFVVPPTLQTEDISPNGSSMLTYEYPTGRRIDVFSLDGGKPIGFRPYDGEPVGGQKVILMRFVSDDRLVTVSEKNVIAVWSLPDFKQLFVTELPGAKSLTLSPNRKYLAGIQAGAVRLLDLTTGTIAGDLVPPFNTLEVNLPSFVIFRADGREVLAGFQHANNTPMLVRWDTATGKATHDDVYTGNLGSRPKQGYVGDNYVMFDFGWIYDLKRRAFVWNLNFNGVGGFSWYRPDDRVWYAVNGFNNDGVIVATNFATEEVDKTVAEVIDGPGAILKPGTKVNLALQADGGMAADYQPKIADALRKSWKARELQIVDQNADVDVTMTVSERDTGEKLSFRTFGSPFGDTIPVLELTAETVVSVNGEELWSPAAAKYQTQGGFFIQLPPGETDIGKHLHKQMWNEVVTWSQNSALPKYLAKTEHGVRVLPMFSKLTVAGITDEVKRRR